MGKMKAFFASLAVAIVAVVGFAQAPAQAAWSDCGNYPDTICLFKNGNWGLPIWRQYPSQIVGCRNLTGFDNMTTIAVNQAPHHIVTLYQLPGCEGESIDLTVNGTARDFTGAWWNDRASAIRVTAL